MSDSSALPRVKVALALVWRDGRVLVGQRPAHVHLPGLWEFPGGKLEAGETPERCAEREALEETGVTCRATGTRRTIVHRYDDRVVELVPVDCSWHAGEPSARAVTRVRWAQPRELGSYAFPDANAELVAELMREAKRAER